MFTNTDTNKMQSLLHKPSAPINHRLVLSLLFGTAWMLMTASITQAATQTLRGSGVTAPSNGLTLNGADLLPHYWVSDHIQGFCRMDPISATNPQLRINPATCISTLASGHVAYDGAFVYIPDGSSKSIGVLRIRYAPTGDGNKGSMSLTRSVVEPNCNLGDTGGLRPAAVAISPAPARNLYISFKNSANIYRVITPRTDGLNCSEVQLISSSSDGRSSAALAFAGPNLWDVGGNGLGVLTNADAKTVQTPAIGVFPGAFTTINSDNNGIVYVAGLTNIQWLNGKTGITAPVNLIGHAGVTGLNAVAGMAGATAPTGTLYVGDDPSGVGTALAGRIYSVSLP